MAIDLKAELGRSRTNLDAYLSKRREALPERVTASRLGSEATRSGFFQKYVDPTIGSGGNITARESTVAQDIGKRTLSREAERSFAARLRNEDVQVLNLIYQNAVRRAIEANNSKEAAEAYGRQVVLNKLQQDFEAEQAQKGRESDLRIADIKDVYAEKTGALAEQYQPRNSFEAAMMRSLFGLGGGLTALGIGKYMRTPKTQPTKPLQPTGFEKAPIINQTGIELS